MKHKNGFTLVEIIAVVVILAVIMLFVTPKLKQLIDNGNNKQRMISEQRIISAAKDYATSYINDFLTGLVNIGDSNYVSISDLLNSGLIDEEDIEAFTNLTGVKGTLNPNDIIEYTLSYDKEIHLTVNLNGGNTNQVFKQKYFSNTKIKLENPTKTDNKFLNWRVISGDASITSDMIRFGNSDTTISAIWGANPRLIVDLNGGTTSQTFNEKYETGTDIQLLEPEKSGSTFGGWEIVSGNSIISGNRIIIGTEDTTIRAIYDACAAGTYADGDSCIPCPIGSYPSTGGSSCVPCQNGTTTVDAGQSSCNASCINVSNVSTWETATWNGTSVENLCKPSTCAAGHELINNACMIRVVNFDFIGDVQTYNASAPGVYKIELWGAQGGKCNNSDKGGKGAYTAGYINIRNSTQLYVYVGGKGTSTAGPYSNSVTTQLISGGYNGGGSARGPQPNLNSENTRRFWGSGGGATDVRLVGGNWDNSESLSSRIMVAAGGGGCYYDNGTVYTGGVGGDLNGGLQSRKITTLTYGSACTGGSQTTGGGYTTSSNTWNQTGYFGYVSNEQTASYYAGGGSGYYGGSNSGHTSGGCGGSSYISGHSGCTVYPGKIFSNTTMTAGDRSGNGYATITYCGSSAC